jgi:hypothetical protein
LRDTKSLRIDNAGGDIVSHASEHPLEASEGTEARNFRESRHVLDQDPVGFQVMRDAAKLTQQPTLLRVGENTTVGTKRLARGTTDQEKRLLALWWKIATDFSRGHIAKILAQKFGRLIVPLVCPAAILVQVNAENNLYSRVE